MTYLVLVRHGQSLWNAKGIWTGLTDVGLSEKGKEEARTAGKAIADINFQVAFVSVLKRAKQTLEEIENTLGITRLPTEENAALNERDYGDYTGKNKWQVKKEIGDKAFLKLRRSWDYPVPYGESLKDVYGRVVPYYKEHILPKLMMGKNVLVSAHGNSLRALVKYLDNLSDESVAKLEIPTGQVLIYNIDQMGKITSKETKGVV